MKRAINVNGTSLQGYITIPMAEIVEKLGAPTFTMGDKVTAEWHVQIGDAVITIYDYKEETTPLRQYDWHIGGFDSSVLVHVRQLFPAHKVRGYRE